MDAEKNYEKFKEELGKLLTKEEFNKSSSWLSLNGNEIEIDIPYPISLWDFRSLGSPGLAARRVVQLIKGLLKKS